MVYIIEQVVCGHGNESLGRSFPSGKSFLQLLLEYIPHLSVLYIVDLLLISTTHYGCYVFIVSFSLTKAFVSSIE